MLTTKSKESIHKRTQKSTCYALGGGKFRTEITGHDQHYRDREDWKPVVESFESKSKDGFGYHAEKMNNIIRVGADGSRRWYPRRDVAEYVEIGAPEAMGAKWDKASFSNVALGKNDREVSLEANNYRFDYDVKWSGLKTILTLEDGAPLRWRYPIIYNNLTEKDKRLFGKDGEEVGRITPTTAVDASGKELAVKETYGKGYIEIEVVIPKDVRISYPITVDPDFACGTADGYVFGQNMTYSTARSTSTLFNQTEESFYVGQDLVSVIKYVYRGFVLFDTSSIPVGDTVTKVNLKLTPVTDASTTNFDVNIIKCDWSDDADFSAAAQREDAYDLALNSDEDDSIWRNTSGISTNTTYTSGNLSTSWVSKTGTTYYALVSNRDYDGSGTQPSGNEYVLIASQDNATSGYRPVLVVEHSSEGCPVQAMHYKKMRG